MEYHIKPFAEAQLPEILEIYNEAIRNTTSVYEYVPRNMQVMEEWYASKVKGNYPLIGLFDAQGALLGFGTYGPFRVRPAYKYTIEHSVYVREDMRGKGFGKILLNEIIASAVKEGYHTIVAGIDADNKVSIILHEKLGFEFAGIIKQAGFKFNRWLDLSFYQLILKTPAVPVEE